MSEKTSVLLSDVAVKGDIVEKETLILNSKVEGDITVGSLRHIQEQILMEILINLVLI